MKAKKREGKAGKALALHRRVGHTFQVPVLVQDFGGHFGLLDYQEQLT